SKAVECVCRSMKSRSQVEKYLRDKGFSDEIIAQTVSKMTEYRYIDDAEYVRAYVSAYGGKKGVRRIKYELSQKGIGRELIDAVDDMLGGQEETAAELARKFMKNRARGRDGAKKLFAHLAAKGFEYSVCADCASRYLDEEDFEV
ncbi:MAG TPA: RecX family transcriptional regulator, partial [Firmicutes bacterium]|nr:RecX family transcriptional regulator [Bacillota bacterium]